MTTSPSASDAGTIATAKWYPYELTPITSNANATNQPTARSTRRGRG